MQIADRLKIEGRSRAKRVISSSEFLDWKMYLEKDVNAFHREDHYAAQIAAELRRTRAKNPNRVKNSQFLIKFSVKAVPIADPEERLKTSKRFWFGLVGLKLEDK